MNSNVKYHHGDLRRALLEAAHEMIKKRGPAGLTLRAVARAADVSHAAPYHHFADKDALLAAVAEDGFDALRESVGAKSATADSPARAMQQAAVAYVVFAIEHPNLFRVMFGPQLADKSAYPSLQTAARATYGAIEGGLRSCVPLGTSSSAVAEMAVASWAATHGLAMLLVDRQLGTVGTDEAEEVARQVTDVLWVGLAEYATA